MGSETKKYLLMPVTRMILLMGAQLTDALYRSGLVVKEKWVTG
ncbi:unnamed protein product, partial [marine sediment metagenome]